MTCVTWFSPKEGLTQTHHTQRYATKGWLTQSYAFRLWAFDIIVTLSSGKGSLGVICFVKILATEAVTNKVLTQPPSFHKIHLFIWHFQNYGVFCYTIQILSWKSNISDNVNICIFLHNSFSTWKYCSHVTLLRWKWFILKKPQICNFQQISLNLHFMYPHFGNFL